MKDVILSHHSYSQTVPRLRNRTMPRFFLWSLLDILVLTLNIPCHPLFLPHCNSFYARFTVSVYSLWGWHLSNPKYLIYSFSHSNIWLSARFPISVFSLLKKTVYKVWLDHWRFPNSLYFLWYGYLSFHRALPTLWPRVLLFLLNENEPPYRW